MTLWGNEGSQALVSASAGVLAVGPRLDSQDRLGAEPCEREPMSRALCSCGRRSFAKDCDRTAPAGVGAQGDARPLARRPSSMSRRGGLRCRARNW